MTVGLPRTIPTTDALRMIEYHSDMPGWHSHGRTLIPTDGCAACNELKRRAEAQPDVGGEE